ncbi:MAG: ParB/RepB/Spo0J family partition protein [Fidelibacterota bacterium]
MVTKRLGRGLEALIPPAESLETTPAGVVKIPLASIKANPQQPRKFFDEATLEELAASIREKGVITPITVRRDGDQFILIAGERRVRAAKLVGLKEIPAYLIEVTGDAEMMEVSLIENIQRENLNPIEEAEAYAVLQGQFNLPQQAIAKAVGKKRSTVTNALRLLRLPPEIKKSIRVGRISAGHGRAILSMKTTPAMMKLWRLILNRSLSVRAAEALVTEVGKAAKSRGQKMKKQSPEVRQMEAELISILGTKVRIKPGSKQQGTIVMEYYSQEDLERLLDLLRSLEQDI